MILTSNFVALTTILSLFSFGNTDLPVVKKNEAYYCERFCKNVGGISEFVLPDRTRADCVTKEHAYECDWAKKWAECIGQSGYYAIVLGKKPVCVLIVENGDNRFAERARTIGDKYGINIEIINR